MLKLELIKSHVLLCHSWANYNQSTPGKNEVLSLSCMKSSSWSVGLVDGQNDNTPAE
jgi:hypothetical protein